MSNAENKKGTLGAVKERRDNSDALRIVRDFQKKYRETIPVKNVDEYQWGANPPSVTEGALTSRSYTQDFQSIL